MHIYLRIWEKTDETKLAEKKVEHEHTIYTIIIYGRPESELKNGGDASFYIYIYTSHTSHIYI